MATDSKALAEGKEVTARWHLKEAGCREKTCGQNPGPTNMEADIRLLVWMSVQNNMKSKLPK